MKKNQPIELPYVVSVRFSEADFRQIVTLVQTGRRTVSQTIRLLIESALRAPKAV